MKTDDMHFRYASFNEWGIPDFLRQPAKLNVPKDMISYSFRSRFYGNRPVLLNCYTDDYRFDIAWNNPLRGLERVSSDRIWAACSPDFSLWLDVPLSVQLWNTYRNRWCGRYWQENGVMVIPSVNWSDSRSWAFCFEGIAKGQIIALRTWATAGEDELHHFLRGYEQSVLRLDPCMIFWFGPIPAECVGDGVRKIMFPVGHRSRRKGEKWAEADLAEAGPVAE